MVFSAGLPARFGFLPALSRTAGSATCNLSRMAEIRCHRRDPYRRRLCPTFVSHSRGTRCVLRALRPPRTRFMVSRPTCVAIMPTASLQPDAERNHPIPDRTRATLKIRNRIRFCRPEERVADKPTDGASKLGRELYHATMSSTSRGWPSQNQRNRKAPTARNPGGLCSRNTDGFYPVLTSHASARTLRRPRSAVRS